MAHEDGCRRKWKNDVDTAERAEEPHIVFEEGVKEEGDAWHHRRLMVASQRSVQLLLARAQPTDLHGCS